MVQLSNFCFVFARRFRFQSDLLVCVGCVFVYFGSPARTHSHTHLRELSTRLQCECVSESGLVEKEVDFIKICWFFSSYIIHLFSITCLHGWVFVCGWKPMQDELLTLYLCVAKTRPKIRGSRACIGEEVHPRARLCNVSVFVYLWARSASFYCVSVLVWYMFLLFSGFSFFHIKGKFSHINTLYALIDESYWFTFFLFARYLSDNYCYACFFLFLTLHLPLVL